MHILFCNFSPPDNPVLQLLQCVREGGELAVLRKIKLRIRKRGMSET